MEHKSSASRNKAERLDSLNDRHSKDVQSKLAKLRQPISVDHNVNAVNRSILIAKHKNECRNNIIHKVEYFHIDKSCSSNNIQSKDQITHKHCVKPESDMNVEQVIKALKIYFSDDMKQHRSYIDLCVKPFIIEDTYVNNHEDKQMMVSKETKKMLDDELKQLREASSVWIEEKMQLLKEYKQMEIDKNLAVEVVAKQDETFAKEILELKNLLHEKEQMFEQKEKEHKDKEAKWKEIKRNLIDSCVKIHEGADKYKQDVAELQSYIKSLKMNTEGQSSVGKEYVELKKVHEEYKKQMELLLNELKKENKALQEKLQYSEVLSEEVPKSDEELKRLKELPFLEENSKMSTECIAIQTDLHFSEENSEGKEIALEQKDKEFKDKETKWKEEKQNLVQSLVKVHGEADQHKKMIKKLQSHIESIELSIKELRDERNSLEKNNVDLRNALHEREKELNLLLNKSEEENNKITENSQNPKVPVNETVKVSNGLEHIKKIISSLLEEKHLLREKEQNEPCTSLVSEVAPKDQEKLSIDFAEVKNTLDEFEKAVEVRFLNS